LDKQSDGGDRQGKIIVMLQRKGMAGKNQVGSNLCLW